VNFRRTWLGLAAVIVIVLAGLPAGTAGSPKGRTTLPNIVLILTDDERWDSLWALANVNKLLVSHGVTFDDGFVVNSLCCPSRATILTGDYSHTTGLYGNGGTYGGYGKFDDSNTAAVWLHGAGYQTALIGKYLNGYNQTYIPPGWDEWDAFYAAGTGGGAYYDYTLNENGTLVSYGNDEASYSTDLLAGKADAWVRAANPDAPLFLYLSVYAGHTPYTPSPTYAHVLNHLPPYRPPNFNEEDVSDKPAWVQALRSFTTQEERTIDRHRRDQYRTLLSADDAVGDIVQALTDTGRLSNTLLVFMSDNGLVQGEHRWTNKKAAYEESIRIPMVIRYDPFTYDSPRSDQHFVLNMDLAPTFAELAGVGTPVIDGTSLMPLVESPDPGTWRSDFLIEHRHENSRDELPTYCAVRNDGYIYVHYLVTGEEELYDLALDPYELDNKVTDSSYGTILDELRAREAELCQPPPPP
jgi:arylsulfatase A-like enzyme